jgi:hypothetical protein
MGMWVVMSKSVSFLLYLFDLSFYSSFVESSFLVGIARKY